MLDFYTIVWGPMARMFAEVTLPSLLQPDNIPKNKDRIGSYNIYSSDKAKRQISSSDSFKKLKAVTDVNFLPLQKGEGEITSNVLNQMKLFAEKNNHMICIGPDVVIGNGSISGIFGLIDKGYNPILYCFPKVSLHCMNIARLFMQRYGSISNRQLVSLSMNYRLSGPYRIYKEDDFSWKVYHTGPLPCISPDKAIIDFFSTNETKNAGFDHILPMAMIEMGYPWLLIRDSDIFFQMELGTRGIRTKSNWHSEMMDKRVEYFDLLDSIWRGENLPAKPIIKGRLRWLDVLSPARYLDAFFDRTDCTCKSCQEKKLIICPMCENKYVGHAGIACPGCGSLPEWISLSHLRDLHKRCKTCIHQITPEMISEGKCGNCGEKI